MKKQDRAPDARNLLAANVQELRIKLGISQEKLAERAGFHRTYVSQVERRLANATVDNVQKLANVLSVPVTRLFELPTSD